MVNELTVILPCAGSGLRLGLNLPKPLFEVFPGLRLIDLTLYHLRVAQWTGMKLRVLVVVSPQTQGVFDYVAHSLPGVETRCCRFNLAYREWPGSVLSASPEFGPYNQVLLPDTFLALDRDSFFFDHQGLCLLERMVLGLKRRPVHFIVVRECSPRLHGLGAVAFARDELLCLSDKPSGDLHPYDGFWSNYGFIKEYGQAVYDHLIAAVEKRPWPFSLAKLGPPGACELHEHTDLGTWDAIDAFRVRFGDGDSFRQQICAQSRGALRPDGTLAACPGSPGR